jgi:hypothetical protein
MILPAADRFDYESKPRRIGTYFTDTSTYRFTDVEDGIKVELQMEGLPRAGVKHINHTHGGGPCADD